MELGLVNLDDGTAMCLKCNRSFTSAAQAKIHYKEIHCTDRNDKKFACAICHKSFAVKRYLNNHMRAQHGLTQFLMKRMYPTHRPMGRAGCAGACHDHFYPKIISRLLLLCNTLYNQIWFQVSMRMDLLPITIFKYLQMIWRLKRA